MSAEARRRWKPEIKGGGGARREREDTHTTKDSLPQNLRPVGGLGGGGVDAPLVLYVDFENDFRESRG